MTQVQPGGILHLKQTRWASVPHVLPVSISRPPQAIALPSVCCFAVYSQGSTNNLRPSLDVWLLSLAACAGTGSSHDIPQKHNRRSQYEQEQFSFPDGARAREQLSYFPPSVARQPFGTRACIPTSPPVRRSIRRLPHKTSDKSEIDFLDCPVQHFDS